MRNASPASKAGAVRAGLPLRAAAAALALALLAGCSGSKREGPRLRLAPTSPNGEVLGIPTAEIAEYRATMVNWFDRIDADHSGTLEKAELVADADRVFASFDLNHDGTITPAELTQARIDQPFQPPMEKPSSRPSKRGPSVTPDGVEENGDRNPYTGQRMPLLRATLDPVMSADSNADFQVTREELRAQAARKFDQYDANHDGHVTREEFLTVLLAPVKELIDEK
jgi:Ca2+-binding EF-hand superfamily protein